MELIPLGNGKFAKVDDEDFERLSKMRWHVMPAKYMSYATCWYVHEGRRIKITMHRFLMNLWPGNKLVVDHIEHDGLNNQKSNLRVCTQQQNLCNNVRYRHRELPKGVTMKGKKFVAGISVDGQRKYLGIFNTKEEAAACYATAAKKQFGNFASFRLPSTVLPLKTRF